MSRARGSSPLSFATDALVFRFGRYGRYISSISVSVSAAARAAAISSVMAPSSVMRPDTDCRFSSRLRRYVSRSDSFLSCSSSRPPVASFLYLEIKGTVFPPSSSSTAASACPCLIPSSFASFSLIVMSVSRFRFISAPRLPAGNLSRPPSDTATRPRRERDRAPAVRISAV